MNYAIHHAALLLGTYPEIETKAIVERTYKCWLAKRFQEVITKGTITEDDFLLYDHIGSFWSETFSRIADFFGSAEADPSYPFNSFKHFDGSLIENTSRFESGVALINKYLPAALRFCRDLDQALSQEERVMMLTLFLKRILEKEMKDHAAKLDAVVDIAFKEIVNDQ